MRPGISNTGAGIEILELELFQNGALGQINVNCVIQCYILNCNALVTGGVTVY